MAPVILAIGLGVAVVAMLACMHKFFADNQPRPTHYGDLVNRYLSDFRNVRHWRPESGLIQRRYMRCADGFEMSVQASNSHYCSPRNDFGPYGSVEVGYPNRPEALLEPYSDGYGGDVFGWVPVAVIEQIVAKHGGLEELQAADVLNRSGTWDLPEDASIRVSMPRQKATV
jgi:hypothetical protein